MHAGVGVARRGDNGHEQVLKLSITRRRQSMEMEIAGFAFREHAVHHEYMRMHVQVGGRPKALHEGDGSRPACPEAPRLGPLGVEGEHRPHEHAEYRDRSRVVIGEPVSKPMGYAEDPLTHGYTRKDSVDDVGGEVRQCAFRRNSDIARALCTRAARAVRFGKSCTESDTGRGPGLRSAERLAGHLPQTSARCRARVSAPKTQGGARRRLDAIPSAAGRAARTRR